ncbi:MAG TPA: YCF48-related protein [Rhodocyclaceae bacterium]|nr:YCF48-related protein [Rhodocyclaceae bacterium]
MDRLPDDVRIVPPLPAVGPANRHPSPEVGTSGFSPVRVLVALLPWLIIGGLLWAAFFIRPQPVGDTVQPPVIERRDHYHGLAALPSGALWLAGSGGKIVAVGADGTAERVATPVQATLQDLAAWDADRAVAVGNDGIVLVTADGGKTWTPAPEVPRSEVANKLIRVHVQQAGRAWAVGEMGALLETIDYGRSWQRRHPEQDTAWNGIAAAGGGLLWVVGEFGQMLRSTDDGLSWEAFTAPVESSLMAVAFRDARHGVAIGLEGVVLVTDDAGEHWTRIDSGVREHLYDVVWDDKRRRWVAAGDQGVWLAGDAAGRQWQHGRVAEREYAWHTRLLPTAAGVWFAGASVGLWADGQWRPLGNPNGRPPGSD